MTLESTKKWILRKTSGTVVERIAKARGIEDVEKFLNPSVKDIPPFTKLFNSKGAAKKIVRAVKEGKKIFVHGDYDADGVCATAILWEFLFFDLAKHLGIKVDATPYIPDRVDEGYGLSEQSIKAIKDLGAHLLISVDCGIRDRDRIEKNISKEFDVIVTDHHEVPKKIKSAKYTIVHQLFPEHEYPYPKVCAAYISFLLVCAIKKEIGMEYKITSDTKGLDLVAIATVTDMMPLFDANRVVVAFGLLQLRRNSRIGITAISRLAEIDINKLDSYHLGFVIGPRINAAGRIGKAMDALRLVLARNQKSALEYSSTLFNRNLQRQASTTEILLQVEALLPEFENEKIIFISGQGWHEGVIGIAAGKLYERFGKPIVITTFNGKEIKGSARSTPTFNITSAIEKYSEHLTKYGGHTQAAGFTTNPEHLDEFRKKLVAFANKNISIDVLEQHIDIDLKIEETEITKDTYNDIEKFQPFGYEHPRPIIQIEKVVVKNNYVLSNGKHLKVLSDKNVTYLLFNADEDVKKIKNNDVIDVVGNISINSWNGKEDIQFQVKEWKRT